MHQWPIVAVAAAVKVDGGTITEARVGLTNILDALRPGRGGGAGGTAGASEDAVRSAAAAADGANPPSDLNGDLTTAGTWPPSRRGVPCWPQWEHDVLMDLTHRFTVPTSVDETWAHFQDIASVAECFRARPSRRSRTTPSPGR